MRGAQSCLSAITKGLTRPALDLEDKAGNVSSGRGWEGAFAPDQAGEAQKATMDNYDYIIVGAGSSGCPVARRLSDDPANRVLLIEAGPQADRFWVNTPAGMAMLYFNDLLNWNYHTEPIGKLAGRNMYWPRGKLLGGSSAINGMIFIRGDRADFDRWRDLGNPGWGYDDVLPHFRAMEHFERRSDEWRGQGGPRRYCGRPKRFCARARCR